MPAGRPHFSNSRATGDAGQLFGRQIPGRRSAFATPRCPISTTPTRWRAICLRDADDAEDAVQECYLRALKHFDSYRGPAMKPWLFAILRNVCRAEYARRAGSPTADIDDIPDDAEQTPLWHEPQETPETQMLRERDASAIRQLVERAGRAVPGDFRVA